MKLSFLNESINSINKQDLHILWYENEKGDKYIPTKDDCPDTIPAEYKYQVSQFPNQLTTTYLRMHDGGSEEIAEGHSTWPEDLALAMANSGDYKLSEAIIILASSCERCMNALGHKYGVDWGYPEESEEWQKAKTVCDYCSEFE